MLEHTVVPLAEPLAPADLCRVNGSLGLIVFAHPEGGARAALRSQSVLLRLQARGFSTLDLDLLSEQESEDPQRMLDVDLMTRRLDEALDALPAALRSEPIGLCAADGAAAAMLRVAACRPQGLRALVSRSGRVDLASELLGDVRIPTLLIVAAGDPEIVELNRLAYARLRCEKRIDVVPRATHHFLEAGTLDVAAQLTGDWMESHFAAPERPPPG